MDYSDKLYIIYHHDFGKPLRTAKYASLAVYLLAAFIASVFPIALPTSPSNFEHIAASVNVLM